MLIALTAVFTAFIAIRTASLGPAAPSSINGIALLWSLLTSPELNMVLQSAVPIVLDLVVVNLGMQEFSVFGISKRRQDTSPIPLVDILYGPYCKSVDLFKPVLEPTLRSNAALTLDTFSYIPSGIWVDDWKKCTSATFSPGGLKTISFQDNFASTQSQLNASMVDSQVPAAPGALEEDSLTEATHLDAFGPSTSVATFSDNTTLASQAAPARSFKLFILATAAGRVFLAAATTLVFLVALSMIKSVMQVDSVANEAGTPLSSLGAHDSGILPATDDEITTLKSDIRPLLQLEVSCSDDDATLVLTSLHHASARAHSNISRANVCSDLPKLINAVMGVPEVISANADVNGPESDSASIVSLGVAKFSNEVTSSRPSIPKSINTGEAEGQTTILPQREQSVADSMWANAPMLPPPRVAAPRNYERPRISTPTQQPPAEASGCGKTIGRANAPLSPSATNLDQHKTHVPRRHQSVADSMWAHVPVLPPPTRAVPRHHQRRHIPTPIQIIVTEASDHCALTELIDWANAPPASSSTDLDQHRTRFPQRHQSVADSMWAHAPVPPPTHAPCSHQRPHTPAPIHIIAAVASGRLVRTQIIRPANASLSSTDLDRHSTSLPQRQQSVADSVWANAPMPLPPPTTTQAAPPQRPHTPISTQPLATEASDRRALTGVVDRAGAPLSPSPSKLNKQQTLRHREQSVADSMWANAPMPSTHVQTAPRNHR